MHDVPMIDYILEIVCATDRREIDELVDGALFMTASLGESSVEAGGRKIRSVYFGSSGDRAAARGMLAELESAVELRDFDLARVDWLERYEQSLAAIEIGERFVV